VVELVTTNLEISALCQPALAWVDASSVVGISQGWTHDGIAFSQEGIPGVVPLVLSNPSYSPHSRDSLTGMVQPPGIA
jgi:hypothetical protein